jgi:hypothetical protein
MQVSAYVTIDPVRMSAATPTASLGLEKLSPTAIRGSPSRHRDEPDRPARGGERDSDGHEQHPGHRERVAGDKYRPDEQRQSEQRTTHNAQR